MQFIWDLTVSQCRTTTQLDRLIRTITVKKKVCKGGNQTCEMLPKVKQNSKIMFCPFKLPKIKPQYFPHLDPDTALSSTVTGV